MGSRHPYEEGPGCLELEGLQHLEIWSTGLKE